MYDNRARLFPDAILARADWRYTRDRHYIAALADAGWPDDTLLYCAFMDDPDDPNQTPAARTLQHPLTQRIQ